MGRSLELHNILHQYVMRYIIAICILLPSLCLFGQSDFTSSNLPIVIINTNGKTIPDEPKISANMKIIYNGQGLRNSVNDTQYNYNGYIGIELRGISSLSFDQKQYTIETRDSSGDNFNVPILDMPAENDWVLHAPYNDISLIRNVLAYHLWSGMGHWAPRTRMVELVLNGEYQGVYVLTETIKRDENRIKIANLKSTDTTGLEITGGYIMKIDASNSDDDITFQSKVSGLGTGFNKSVIWLYHYPDPKEIHTKQQEYIHNYIDTIELLIQSDEFDDPICGYAKYLSLQSFIDYFIHTELSLNSDGYKRSAYFYKEKMNTNGTKGKFKAGSVWDYNLAFGNCNFCKGNKVNAWVYEGCETLPVPAIWKRLIEDPNFINAVKCRYLELRDDILSDSYLHPFIDDYAVMLDEAQARHFQRWDDLLTDDDSSPGGFWDNKLWFSAYRVSSYAEEIEILKGWLSARLNFLDNNLGGTCLSTVLNNGDVNFYDLIVFPNPASELVVVESSKPLNAIEIYNITGYKIAEKCLNNADRIVLSEFAHYPEGLYLMLFLASDGTRITRTIVKQ
jgi:spore coat protein CotH